MNHRAYILYLCVKYLLQYNLKLPRERKYTAFVGQPSYKVNTMINNRFDNVCVSKHYASLVNPVARRGYTTRTWPAITHLSLRS